MGNGIENGIEVTESTTPVPCPIVGPATFTYSDGRGKCDTRRTSTIDTCTDATRWRLRFEPCRNNHGDEVLMDFECTAEWTAKMGRVYFAARRVDSARGDDEYRCFVRRTKENNRECDSDFRGDLIRRPTGHFGRFVVSRINRHRSCVDNCQL